MADPPGTTEGHSLDLSASDSRHASEQPTDSSPEVILRHLLQMLYSHEDKQSAVAAALKAVMSLQQEEGQDSGEEEELMGEVSMSCPPMACLPGSGQAAGLARSASDGSNVGVPTGTSSGPGSGGDPAEGGGQLLGGGGGGSAAGGPDRAGGPGCGGDLAPREDLASALNSFPGCKRLVDAYRRIFRIPNKTPLSVLYEYASRLNLVLSFEEYQDSMGPFTMESKLKDVDGTVLYRPGVGRARAKKDAKQLAAASLLEILLETVPFQDLLYKSVKQQQLRDLQALRPRGLASAKGRLGYRIAGRPPHPQARHLGKPPPSMGGPSPHLLHALGQAPAVQPTSGALALGGAPASQALAAAAAAAQLQQPGGAGGYLGYLQSVGAAGGLLPESAASLGSGASASAAPFASLGGLDFGCGGMENLGAMGAAGGQGFGGGFPTLDISSHGGLLQGGLLGGDGGGPYDGGDGGHAAPNLAGLEAGLNGLSFDNMNQLLDMSGNASHQVLGGQGVYNTAAMNAIGPGATGFARRSSSWMGQCDALA